MSDFYLFAIRSLLIENLFYRIRKDVTRLGSKAKTSLLFLGLSVLVPLLSGCKSMVVLDPKGPVAAQQKDLIYLSIGFMLFIIIAVFTIYAFVLVKYRERPHDEPFFEKPAHRRAEWLEAIWIGVPLIIVIALSIPTVKTIYSLEEPPKADQKKEPLVIEATSVNWKWIFRYPEENIETVNEVYIPEDRPIKFKLTSADAMAAFWVPALGGQEYNMAGMQGELYLQADEPGTFNGRNANYSGEGFTFQKFKVYSKTTGDYKKWVSKTQANAPKLEQKTFENLMLPGLSSPMAFSSTHEKFVDFAKEPEYATDLREKHKQQIAKEQGGESE